MYNYRCTRSRCRARTTLKKKKEAYAYPERKVCPKCGWRISYDPEPKRRSKRDTCYCDGYPFPHRHRSGSWCRDSLKGPSDSDYRDRYGPSATDLGELEHPTTDPVPAIPDYNEDDEPELLRF